MTDGPLWTLAGAALAASSVYAWKNDHIVLAGVTWGSTLCALVKAMLAG